MGIQHGAGVTVINSTWSGSTKTRITGKSLLVQYEEDSNEYDIFAFDGPGLVYTCTIYKGTVPSGVIDSGYSQATNDTDKTDFVNNYKPTANTAIGDPTGTTGNASPARVMMVGGSDGTNIRNFSSDTLGRLYTRPLGTGGALQTDNAGFLVVRNVDSANVCFSATTNGSVSTGTSVNTVTSIATWFYPGGSNWAGLTRVIVTAGGGTGGAFHIRLRRITAEGAGGSSATTNQFNPASAAASARVKYGTGAPTRTVGDVMTWACSGGTLEVLVEWDVGIDESGLVVSASGQGFEVSTEVVTTITTAARVAATFIWIEG